MKGIINVSVCIDESMGYSPILLKSGGEDPSHVVMDGVIVDLSKSPASIGTALTTQRVALQHFSYSVDGTSFLPIPQISPLPKDGSHIQIVFSMVDGTPTCKVNPRKEASKDQGIDDVLKTRLNYLAPLFELCQEVFGIENSSKIQLILINTVRGLTLEQLDLLNSSPNLNQIFKMFLSLKHSAHARRDEFTDSILVDFFTFALHLTKNDIDNTPAVHREDSVHVRFPTAEKGSSIRLLDTRTGNLFSLSFNGQDTQIHHLGPDKQVNKIDSLKFTSLHNGQLWFIDPSKEGKPKMVYIPPRSESDLTPLHLEFKEKNGNVVARVVSEQELNKYEAKQKSLDKIVTLRKDLKTHLTLFLKIKIKETYRNFKTAKINALVELALDEYIRTLGSTNIPSFLDLSSHDLYDLFLLALYGSKDVPESTDPSVFLDFYDMLYLGQLYFDGLHGAQKPAFLNLVSELNGNSEITGSAIQAYGSNTFFPEHLKRSHSQMDGSTPSASTQSTHSVPTTLRTGGDGSGGGGDDDDQANKHVKAAAKPQQTSQSSMIEAINGFLSHHLLQPVSSFMRSSGKMPDQTNIIAIFRSFSAHISTQANIRIENFTTFMESLSHQQLFELYLLVLTGQAVRHKQQQYGNFFTFWRTLKEHFPDAKIMEPFKARLVATKRTLETMKAVLGIDSEQAMENAIRDNTWSAFSQDYQKYLKKHRSNLPNMHHVASADESNRWMDEALNAAVLFNDQQTWGDQMRKENWKNAPSIPPLGNPDASGSVTLTEHTERVIDVLRPRIGQAVQEFWSGTKSFTSETLYQIIHRSALRIAPRSVRVKTEADIINSLTIYDIAMIFNEISAPNQPALTFQNFRHFLRFVPHLSDRLQQRFEKRNFQNIEQFRQEVVKVQENVDSIKDIMQLSLDECSRMVAVQLWDNFSKEYHK